MNDNLLQLNAFWQESSLISENDLQEANERRERLGGSIVDHLYALKAAGEDDLLKAISESLGWLTVTVSRVNPSPSALSLISGPDAWEARVLPYAVDSETQTVKIACRNPRDEELQKKLRTLIPDRSVELHAAIGPVLDCAIMEVYRETLSSFTSEVEGTEVVAEEPSGSKTTEPTPDKTALIVAADMESERYLGSALLVEGYQVVLCQTPAEALEEFEQGRPRLILIRDSVRVRYARLLERAEKLTPDCVVRFYSNTAELVSNPDQSADRELMLTTNLQMATAAMASVVGESAEEAVRTGRYVEKLCRNLQLDSYSRLVLVNSACLLDISRLYFRNEPPTDRETALYRLLSLTGHDLVHSPSVLKAIRNMYPDLARLKAEEARSAEMVHGNILTVVDFYLRQFRDQDRLTPHRYATVQNNLRAQVGEILLPGVTEAFLKLLKEEVDYSKHDRSVKRVLVLDELQIAGGSLTEKMKLSGFECTVTDAFDRFLYLFNQRRPDFAIVAARGNSERVEKLVCRLAASGVVFPDIPSFVLHESTASTHVAPLLEMGLRDVIRFDGDCNIVRIRMEQILAARERESVERLRVLQDMGTHGNLEHMNVIDLLQAVRPGDKTARISVTALGRQLTMYLDKGRLLYAECDGHTGAKAVFEALTWDSGIWSVDHIDKSELPEPNNERSIDSILIEGCTYIDELGRDKQLSEESEISFSF